jgi:putative inorganic carbon (HCO3(-)) transporter
MDLKNHQLYRLFLIGFSLILTLPLLVLQPWFAPPDWGKTIVFRIILSVLIFLFLDQFILNKNKDQEIVSKLSFLLNKKNTIFWLIISFLALNLLAAIFSLEPGFSFWGSPYRSGGFINLLFYAIFGLLAFLILKKNDWSKLWQVAIIIGILVSVLAIFQWQGLFKDTLITYELRPPSTLGNPIMLALYLLLLSLPTLSWGIKETKPIKKTIYFSIFFLFVFVILLTYSRAAFLGLAIGLLWFLLFYPKRLLLVKITTILIVILGTSGLYYLNTNPQLPEFIQENKTLKGLVSRLSIERAERDPRISGWQISWPALKDRPILGYGPENFSFGFDKYYDPTLSGLEKSNNYESWWDKAHNFIFDLSVTAGIPALIAFLALIFAVLGRLQALKPNVTSHSLQATFLAYLTANFFSFDTFSIYLIFFLLIGLSLHLIYNSKTENSAIL